MPGQSSSGRSRRRFFRKYRQVILLIFLTLFVMGCVGLLMWIMNTPPRV
jgi:phosphotransferase system  glucose/maltose/N-acetylglucosamine-specific IIC component